MANDLAKPSASQAMVAFVTEQIPRINKVAGKFLTGEKLTTLVGVAMTKTPALVQCDKMSILQACMYAGRLGLEPNTPLQHAYFIPYNGVCQLQIGYRGMVELVRRSGYRVQSEVVYANDEFTVSYTERPPIKHKPKLTGGRGEIIGAWALVWREDEKPEDATPFWMPIEDIHAIRDKSAARNGPWSNPAFYPEMVRKTVIKRACKHTPMNEIVAEASMIDDGERIPELDIKIEQEQPTRTEETAARIGAKPVANTAAKTKKPATAPAEGGENSEAAPAPKTQPAVATEDAPTYTTCVAALVARNSETMGEMLARTHCTKWLREQRRKDVKAADPDDCVALMAAIEQGVLDVAG